MYMKRFLLIAGLCAIFLLLLFSYTTGAKDDLKIETRYHVNQDLSLSVISGDFDDVDVSAWKKVINILPKDLLKQHVVELHAFSDGVDGTLAFVEANDTDESRWTFAIDYEDAVDTESDDFISTVIHEFAHILSLSPNQIQQIYDSCDSYEIEEGCAKEGSYINGFYKTFWQGDLSSEHKNLIDGLEGDDKEAIIADFFDAHSESFVNEYAATNPPEDFAESFMFFVLSEKINNPISMKEKKQNFFYNYPKLAEIRDTIRANTRVRK
ncbi:MAG: hypothetical protein CSA42_05395 [Gammaproteobacteria bacterium]|nr:MAG: hypothetical protein CSA42_05395 [Gammaproteobacteria bacterium]